MRQKYTKKNQVNLTNASKTSETKIGGRSVLAVDHKKNKFNVPEQFRMPDNWTRAPWVRSMKAKIQKQIGASSDLAVDPEKTKEPSRPADLRWNFYKDPSHGGGLRTAFLDIGKNKSAA